jgi:fucose permease
LDVYSSHRRLLSPCVFCSTGILFLHFAAMPSIPALDSVVLLSSARFAVWSRMLPSLHPPFPVVVSILAIAGFGNGLIDAGWNAWVGDMVHANELLGIVNGLYGLGATISPLIISSMVNKYGFPWYTFFYIMIGLLVMELVATASTFWSETGREFRRRTSESRSTLDGKGGRTRTALKRKITWLCALMLWAYVGCEGMIIISLQPFIRLINRSCSITRWLDYHFYDKSPQRRPLFFCYRQHWFLDWHYPRPYLPWILDISSG